MKTPKDFILTTASTIEGYKIIEQHGLVFGETVFKHGFLARFGADFSNTVDLIRWGSREMSGSVDLIEQARQFAYDKMIEEAKNRGANAIIAIDSDNTFGNDMMYLSLYGTAVKAVPEAEYEQKMIEKKEAEAKRKAEAEQKEFEMRMHQGKLRERRAAGDLWREEKLLDEIRGFDSVTKIWEVWSASSIADNYPDITSTLKAQKNSERMYGKMPGEAESLKKIIRKRILGEE